MSLKSRNIDFGISKKNVVHPNIIIIYSPKFRFVLKRKKSQVPNVLSSRCMLDEAVTCAYVCWTSMRCDNDVTQSTASVAVSVAAAGGGWTPSVTMLNAPCV